MSKNVFHIAGSKTQRAQAIVLLCILQHLGGCTSVNPPKVPEAEGPKRPVNVLTTEQNKILRVGDKVTKR